MIHRRTLKAILKQAQLDFSTDERTCTALGYDHEQDDFILADLYVIPEMVALANNPYQTARIELTAHSLALISDLPPDNPCMRDLEAWIRNKTGRTPYFPLRKWIEAFYTDLIPEDQRNDIPE